MEYTNYYYGMNVIWWVLWMVLLFWIFAVPYDIPGQRRKKDSALDALQKRYANGNITGAEYLDQKRILDQEPRKLS